MPESLMHFAEVISSKVACLLKKGRVFISQGNSPRDCTFALGLWNC